jgi:transcriptional regulator NrdR family protein
MGGERVMKCPYCGENLYMYEDWKDLYDGETIKTEEHWECENCHRTFARNVTYKIVEEGALTE